MEPNQDQSQPNTSQPVAANPQTAASNTPNAPTQAAAPSQPSPLRPGLFDRVLEGMAGGPTRVTDPQTGVTKELPMSKKSLTAHILAAAITGIISGASASANAPAGPAGTNTPANMAALGAGASGAQQKLQDIRNAPQQQLDLQQLRKANAIKNTTQELANQMAADKLHEDDWSRKENYYQGNKDVYQPILNDIEATEKELPPGQPSLFVGRNLSHEDAMRKIVAHAGEFSPIMDGWTTETHDDGRTYHVPTFALIRNGSINVSKEALTALAPFDKGVKDLLEKGVTGAGNTVSLSAPMLIGFEKSATAAKGAYEFVRQMQDGLGIDASKQLGQSEFNEKFRTNPALKQQVTSLMSTLSNLGTQSTAHALAQLQASGKAGEIFKLIGASPDKIQNFIDDKQNEALAAAAKAKKVPVAIDSANHANEILADPNAAPELKQQATAFLNNNRKQEQQKENDKAAVQEKTTESKQTEKDKRDMVYAEDQSGQLVYTTRYDAENNLKATPASIRSVKPSDVNKDTQASRMLNDVQLNTSRYSKAASDALNNPPTSEDYLNMHSILNKAGVGEIGAGSWDVKLPLVSHFAESLGREMQSEAYADLTPQGKALMDGYYRAMAAVPAYQKALTGIGRSNKEMLDLELANIANPTMKPADIVRKQQQFQENIDRASEGFPRLPGVKTAKQTRQEIEGAQQQQPQAQSHGVTHILHNGKVVPVPQGVTHILDPKTGKVITIPGVMLRLGQ